MKDIKKQELKRKLTTLLASMTFRIMVEGENNREVEDEYNEILLDMFASQSQLLEEKVEGLRQPKIKGYAYSEPYLHSYWKGFNQALDNILLIIKE